MEMFHRKSRPWGRMRIRLIGFYKYLAGILELASANPRFTPLLRYVEKVSGMHRTEATAQDRAVTVVKNWRRLGAQVENVGKTLR